jgi:predicted dehydrogenase
LLTAALENGLIGDVLSYDAEFGVRFDWPTVSGFYFDRARAGGGVVMSEGIHTLDRLIHWFGDVTDVTAADNNHGRIETEATLHLTHQRDVRGRARFSWLHDLRNTVEVRGSEGRAVVSRDDPWSVSLYRTLGGREWRFDMRDAEEPVRVGLDHFEAQLADFLDAVTTGRKPCVDGREGAKVMWLVEEVYRRATRLVHSWGAS